MPIKYDLISREDILDLMSQEKEIYNSYLQMCAYYKIEPSIIAKTSCLAKIEILHALLNSDNKNARLLEEIKKKKI